MSFTDNAIINNTYILDNNTLTDNIKKNKLIATGTNSSLPEEVRLTIELSWDDNNMGTHESVYETYIPYNNFVKDKLSNNAENIKTTYTNIYGCLYNNFINDKDCIDYMSRTKTGPFRQNLIDRSYHIVNVCIGTYHIYKSGTIKCINMENCITFNSTFELYRNDINLIHWRHV